MSETKQHPLKAIRRACVPLAAFETADPASTIAGCLKALNGRNDDVPLIAWDIVTGWQGLNESGQQSLDWYDPAAMQFPETLKLLGEKAPKGLLAFVHNPQRIFDRDGVVQAFWNLRDQFKRPGVGANLIMLGPSFTLPAELVQDVVVISEPLPNEREVGQVVDDIVKGAQKRGAAITDDFPRARVVDTLLGLSAFACEQVLAMSISKEGIDLDQLWQRKSKLIEQTPGLSVWRGGETFDQLGGLSNLKTFLNAVLTSGNTPVRCIGFIDEIEKGFAGASGDLSGVSQDQLGVFLRVMQDQNIPGIILVGPPGTGKSAIAKAAGAVAGAQVLSIDMGAMTGSLVGESQRKIRLAMDVFQAVSQGKGLFIATCNKIASLPPELRRRFTLGTFYVDLPSGEERDIIWPIWVKRYGLAKQTIPPCEGWTGAEIRACCDVAFRTGMSLADASKFVVPVCKSAAESIKTLREMASGRFISANQPGVYKVGIKVETAGREMEF